MEPEENQPQGSETPPAVPPAAPPAVDAVSLRDEAAGPVEAAAATDHAGPTLIHSPESHVPSADAIEQVEAAWSESLQNPADIPTAAVAAPDPAAVGSVDTPMAAVAEEVPSPATEARAEPSPGGPNWMLAFVCAWAGATSLNEALAVLVPQAWRLSLLRSPVVIGYLLVGVGLLAFAAEALRWGSRQRNALGVALPALVTLGGLVALIIAHDPGRRI